jgi:transmembrane sensor
LIVTEIRFFDKIKFFYEKMIRNKSNEDNTMKEHYFKNSKMQAYSNFSIHDFIMDENFQRWVMNPTLEDASFWENFQSANPHKVADIQKAVIILTSMKNDNQEEGLESRMNLVWERIIAQNNEESNTEIVKLNPWYSAKWLKIAASVILVLGSVSTAYFYQKNQNNTYQSAYGENREVKLPDGSIVKLNANSTLKISDDWSNEHTREVWLKGEAFFTVTKKPNQGNAKFIVHANNINVEVLGTEFNVSNRDTNTNVTLNSGKIKLDVFTNGNTQTIMMKPGEQVNYSSKSSKVYKKKTKAEVVSAWTSNHWVLESTSLGEVANKIEDNFGVTVIIKDPNVVSDRMTGVIMTNNLDEVLEGLSTIYSLKFKKENNQVILEK